MKCSSPPYSKSMVAFIGIWFILVVSYFSLCTLLLSRCGFFFNDSATTEIYTLSLHDALPICHRQANQAAAKLGHEVDGFGRDFLSGEGEVAFVFAVFVVDDDDHAAGADKVTPEAINFKIGRAHV